MNDTEAESASPAEAAASQTPRTSLAGRLFNVLAAPGEVFAEVKTGPPRAANWLVPTLLLILAGWLGVWLIYSQAAFRQQQDEAKLKVLQRLVEKGKLTKEQFEQAQQGSGGGSAAGYILGPAAGVLGLSLASPFWGAFLIWLIGAKIHRGGYSYGKALEVAGLANMVAVLGAVVRTLMILAMGNLQVGPTPALFIRDFDPFNLTHTALGMLDVFGLWVCAVRASGMARLGNLAFGLCLTWLLLIWAGLNGLVLGAIWAFRTLLGL
jgi:hypothetical protein